MISTKEMISIAAVHQLKKRDLYLNRLIAFQDIKPVKVVTGIRRCGKSYLLKLMMQHLKAQGGAENQIVAMNFLLRLCQTAGGARETDVFLL